MKEVTDKLAEIARIAGEILQNLKSDSQTRLIAGNLHRMAMEERGRIINDEKNVIN